MFKKMSIIVILTITGSLCFAQSGSYGVVNPSHFLNKKIEKFVEDHIVEGVAAYSFEIKDGMPVITPKYDQTYSYEKRPSKEANEQLRDMMTQFVQCSIPEAWRDETPDSVVISDTAIVITNRHQDTLARYTVTSTRQQSNGNFKFSCKEARKAATMEKYTDRIWLLKIDGTEYEIVLKQ